jgi:hypothetical protein
LDKALLLPFILDALASLIVGNDAVAQEVSGNTTHASPFITPILHTEEHAFDCTHVSSTTTTTHFIDPTHRRGSSDHSIKESHSHLACYVGLALASGLILP